MSVTTPVVTLTTDFGTRDSYAAQLKGVLLARCARLRVIDLTHDIAAHDVLEGALFLAGAVPAFPPGTVHLAVVDPGVGGARRRVAVEAAGQRIVCPDNGLLTLLAREHPIEAAHELTNPDLRREPVSATFEGRDVFAPAAAHLACGGALADLGPPVTGLARLDVPEPEPTADGARGEVMHIDRFGNAITNIPASMLPEGPAAVRAAGRDPAAAPHLRRRRARRGAGARREQRAHRGRRARGQRRRPARAAARRCRAGRGYWMSARSERASRSASARP